MESTHRSDYLDKLQPSLRQWSDQIDGFERQLRSARKKQNVRNYEYRLMELRARQAELERRLRECENEDDAAWEGLRMALDDTVRLFKDAFERASKTFKELV
ncbi:MAG: hypothetical protein ACE5LB_02465 [Acidiferrobacterales bacterium]